MNKRIARTLLFLGIVAVACSVFAEVAEASHFRYGHVTWRRIGGPTSRTVEITVTEAWRATAVDYLIYNYGDGSGSFASSPYTTIATLNDLAGEGYTIKQVKIQHTYPADGPYLVWAESCCRIGSLINAGNNSERLEMVVDLRNGNMGSPVSSIPVILQMVPGGVNTVPLAIGDADGDPFTVRMSTNAESRINALAAGPAGPLTVSPSGVLSWNTTGLAIGNKFAVQIMIEEHHPNGASGKVPLDFIIEIAGGTINKPPMCMLNGSASNLVNPGQPFTISLTGTDPDGGMLKVNHLGLPPGATLTPPTNSTGNVPFTVTFSWTPGIADIGSAHAVTIIFSDPAGLQSQCSFSIQVNQLQPPPFTNAVASGHICLPPFMVQDPSKTHYWWARAAGGGDLEIEFSAVSVNPIETGNATIRVYSPSNTLIATANVVHPAGGETAAPPIIIPGPAAGSLYRIEVNVAPLPPQPAQGARHYRLELEGAEQLGTNSPLQAQEEAEPVRWGVNVLSGEPLDVVVQGAPEAPATMGGFEVRDPFGALVTTSALGTPVSIPSAATGMWTVTMTGLDHHVILSKTSGADRGLYLGAFSDVLPPQIFPPAPISLTTGPNATTCGLPISDQQLGSATAKDNCEVHVTRTGVPQGNFFPVGPTTITYTATDGAGNQTSATQLVTVIDNTPPTITCPENIFVTIPSGDASAVVKWEDPAASDNCSVTVACSPESGSAFPPGTTTVTCTATDPSGNTAVCMFTVTVNRAPDCTATPSIAEIWPPDHKMVNITIQGGSDPDGDPVTVTITGITQDEPLNTLGDGNTEPDGAIVGTSVARVRAERSGTPRVPGNGRVYRISFTLSDGRGGECEGNVSVCVPHDQGNQSVCIDDGQRYNSITGETVSTSSLAPGAFADVALAGESPAALPESYGLLNAYPNPFNPSTNIQYDLPEETHVRLAVFDLLGREVALLVDGQRSAGRYNISFDASGLKSGMYLYRLETPAFRQTKRFILLK